MLPLILAIEMDKRKPEEAVALSQIAAGGLRSSIAAKHGDCHHLEEHEDNPLGGYPYNGNLDSFCEPSGGLQEFYHTLTPRARLAMHE